MCKPKKRQINTYIVLEGRSEYEDENQQDEGDDIIKFGKQRVHHHIAVIELSRHIKRGEKESHRHTNTHRRFGFAQFTSVFHIKRVGMRIMFVVDYRFPFAPNHIGMQLNVEPKQPKPMKAYAKEMTHVIDQ